MDLPTRQPSCAYPSTRRRPRPAAPSLTPSRRATDVARAACASRRRARIGRYAASIAPLPATATPRSSPTLNSTRPHRCPAFEDETSGRSRARGARAGGARVDRRLEVPEQAVRASTDVAARGMVLLAHERYVLWSGWRCRATCSSSSSSPRSVELRMPPASRPAVVVVLSTADGIALPSGLHVRAAAARAAARVSRRRDDARLRHRPAADARCFLTPPFLCNVCTISSRV